MIASYRSGWWGGTPLAPGGQTAVLRHPPCGALPRNAPPSRNKEFKVVEAVSFTIFGRVVQTDLSLALEAKAQESGLTGWCRDDLEAGVPGARIDVVDWETVAARRD